MNTRQIDVSEVAQTASPFRFIALAWACVWWSVRLHMAETHGLPRESAGPPPLPGLAPQAVRWPTQAAWRRLAR
jgi:hypothetical protein